MEDNQIIDLYWERSENAIVETDKKYGRYCYSIAAHIVENEEDARECVNDTWLKAWETIPPNRPNRLSTFLGKITRNLALDRYRYHGAGKRNYGRVPLALDELKDCIPERKSYGREVEDLEIEEILNTFLENLTELNRKIFMRRHWYFDSVREIAAGYAISESQVKMSLMRSRNQLKKVLKKEEAKSIE